MKGLCLLLCVAALTGTSVFGRNEPTEGDVNIDQHLRYFATNRFPVEQHEHNRLQAQEYIKEAFKNSNLDRVEHRFNTTIRDDDGDDQVVEGLNIIGINRHKSDDLGGVLLIGADYDNSRPACSELNSDGCVEYFQNNGVGIAAMLEIARLFDHNTRFGGEWRNDLTTIFVAFDINTKEHMADSPGKPGSKKFLEEWLWDYLGESKEHFGGAIIIDSITKLNYENSSQIMGNSFKKAFPTAHERISARGKKGDFLGVVTNGDDTIGKLKDQFKMQYELKMKMKRPFTLEDMELQGRPTEVLELLNDQAHYNFWTFKDSDNNPHSLPAMLLTDTEGKRSLPEECAGKICSHTLKTYMDDKDRKTFVEATVNGVVGTLLHRQAHRIEHNSSMNNLPSIMASLLLMLFVKLLQ